MAELTLSSAITLIKGGVFPEGDLVTVLPHGAALICGPQRTPILRPSGPRPEGVTPYRAFTPPADDSVTGLVGTTKPRRDRKSGKKRADQ
jgi:hypothetical protein